MERSATCGAPALVAQSPALGNLRCPEAPALLTRMDDLTRAERQVEERVRDVVAIEQIAIVLGAAIEDRAARQRHARVELAAFGHRYEPLRRTTLVLAKI